MTITPPPLPLRLRARIHKRLLNLQHRRQVARDGRALFTPCRYFGADFIVRLDDFIGWEMAAGIFEWSQLTLMLDMCRRLKPAAFLDIGAHAGLYTCVVGRARLAPRLIAFEPERRTLVHLKANLLINDLLKDVELHEAAVGATAGHAPFVQAADHNRGESKIDPGHPDAYQVPVVAIDEVVPFSGARLAIKMDVEGHEMPAFDGAERLFRDNSGYAQIEAYEGRAAQVTPRMEAFGWRQTGACDDDLMFEKA
jgi:FkbM family methyltransferase